MSEEYFDRPDETPGQPMQHQGQMGQFPPMQHQGQMGQFPPMQHEGQMGQFPPMQHQGQMGQFGHEPFEGFILPPFVPGPHHFGQFAPTIRPPEFIVRRPIHHPGSIRACANRFVYIWFHDGRNFWAWIPFVSRRTIYGYRWNGHRWIYFEADVNEVETFVCI